MPFSCAISFAFLGSKTSILSNWGDISTVFLICKNSKFTPINHSFFTFFLKKIEAFFEALWQRCLLTLALIVTNGFVTKVAIIINLAKKYPTYKSRGSIND